MEIKPHPFSRGDMLDDVEDHLIGGIGAFSEACINGTLLKQPLEVVLVEGSRVSGFKARLGDAHHHLYEGILTRAQVSFTLEAFETDGRGDIIKNLKKDSRSLRFGVKENLRDFILESAAKLGIKGGLLYLKGVAKELHVYGHTDTQKLNDQTKTFDHPKGPLGVEGWGNLSFVDGDMGKPFVHLHGTYEAYGKKKGGHFIMDNETSLLIEKAELIIFPVDSLVRTMEKEDFPTWKV